MKLVKNRKPPSDSDIRKVAEWLTYFWLKPTQWGGHWDKKMKWRKQQVVQFFYYKPSFLGIRIAQHDAHSNTCYYIPGHKRGGSVDNNTAKIIGIHWRDHFKFILEKTEELFPGYTDRVLKIAEMQLDEKAVVNL